jgi:hypothetical protein
MKERGEGGVVFCDLPTIPAGPVGKFIVQQMAAVADLEREMMQASWSSLRQIAATMAAKGIRTARGGEWTAMAVKNALDRAAAWQADRRCGRSVPLTGGTVGQHCDQHGPIDDCRARRTG